MGRAVLTITVFAAAFRVCGWTPAASAQDVFRAAPGTYAPRYDPRHDDRRTPYPVVPYAVVLDDPLRGPDGRVPAPARQPRGTIELIVRPVTAQAFVDGFFVGTVDDFARGGGPLVEAGVHRVELRARGYDTARFEVYVPANGTATYRKVLSAVPPEVNAVSGISPQGSQGPAEPAVLAPRTFYVVAGCYAGDKPPQRDRLPAACDVTQVRQVPGLGTSAR